MPFKALRGSALRSKHRSISRGGSAAFLEAINLISINYNIMQFSKIAVAAFAAVSVQAANDSSSSGDSGAAAAPVPAAAAGAGLAVAGVVALLV